jgi:two-component system LytT family response regulator
VIFTTAYRDYALEGFELDAVDYLLKPIVFQRFFKGIEKFLATQKESNSYLFIRENRKQIKLDDILYVESLKDYIKIYLAEETHLTKYGISAFEEELDFCLMRVHRSFIVNSGKVTAYTKQDVEIGEAEIPIGENYKEKLERL